MCTCVWAKCSRLEALAARLQVPLDPTWNLSTRSPLGPPAMPALPKPFRRSTRLSSTPAGTLTAMRLRTLVRPSPWQLQAEGSTRRKAVDGSVHKSLWVWERRQCLNHHQRFRCCMALQNTTSPSHVPHSILCQILCRQMAHQPHPLQSILSPSLIPCWIPKSLLHPASCLVGF